jgi:hypothetical protein
MFYELYCNIIQNNNNHTVATEQFLKSNLKIITETEARPIHPTPTYIHDPSLSWLGYMHINKKGCGVKLVLWVSIFNS